jgi:hypothetical protein
MISSIAINYRINQLLPSSMPLAIQKAKAEQIASREEGEADSLIPIEIFSEEQIEMQKRMHSAVVAHTWGLVLHRDTPNFEALTKLLNVRYHNSTDDIAHEDIFLGLEL